jgi:hypothetical protein
MESEENEALATIPGIDNASILHRTATQRAYTMVKLTKLLFRRS